MAAPAAPWSGTEPAQENAQAILARLVPTFLTILYRLDYPSSYRRLKSNPTCQEKGLTALFPNQFKGSCHST